MDDQTTLVAVDPRDGRVLGDMTVEPSTVLADLVLELKRRESELRSWRDVVEAELRGRLAAEHRRLAVVGDYELRVDSGRGEWDGDELEGVLRALIDDGTLAVRDVTGIVTRQTKVDGHAARRLLNSLTGPPKAAVGDCYRQGVGKPRLTVTRAVELLPAP
jgi:hypothetical protein